MACVGVQSLLESWYKNFIRFGPINRDHQFKHLIRMLLGQEIVFKKAFSDCYLKNKWFNYISSFNVKNIKLHIDFLLFLSYLVYLNVGVIFRKMYLNCQIFKYIHLVLTYSFRDLYNYSSEIFKPHIFITRYVFKTSNHLLFPRFAASWYIYLLKMRTLHCQTRLQRMPSLLRRAFQ